MTTLLVIVSIAGTSWFWDMRLLETQKELRLTQINHEAKMIYATAAIEELTHMLRSWHDEVAAEKS
jgi:hypothetical protein